MQTVLSYEPTGHRISYNPVILILIIMLGLIDPLVLAPAQGISILTAPTATFSSGFGGKRVPVGSNKNNSQLNHHEVRFKFSEVQNF